MLGTPKYGHADKHFAYANPDAPKGGTLSQAALGTFDTLNPFTLKGTAAQGLNLAYDRLMIRGWDEPFTLYPLIAQRVEVPEDRSSLTVHIDPRARFHDGSAITADDVLFSFETLKEKGRPNMRRIYKLVSKTEKIDDRTIKFTLGPGYDRETVMILAMMPVLSKTWWQGRDFEAALLEPPLLNGPYKIARVDPGRRIVLERVPDYWAKDLLANRGHFNFDNMIFEYYRDDGVAFEAFKSGDLTLRREFDAAKWMSSYDDIPAVKEGKIIRESLPHGRPEKVQSLIFNTRRPPFDDIRVRQALSLALDFDWINKNLFGGNYKRITSYYPNSYLAASYDKNKEAAPSSSTPAQLRENLKRADDLLKKAGWTVVDGRRMKDGKIFTFELILGAPGEEKIALAFARTLKRLGIDITIRVLDSAAFLGRLNDYDYDMVLYFWLNTLSPGSEQRLYWTCEAAAQKGRWNYAGICDPKIDSLSASIAEARTAEELTTRVQALDRLLMAGHYMIPLYYAGTDNVAYRAGLRRPETPSLYGMVLETWWQDP